MAKVKGTSRLKVFSTPIGFHDALVAAPSQKAALEAWGAGTNLFSQGSAHVVTDPKLMKLPLQHPGQVVKVPRGSQAEQLAALDEQKRPRRSAVRAAEILPKKSPKRLAKPDRAALTRAESQLEKLEEEQAGEREKIDREMKALEQRRRDMERRHERERDKAQGHVEEERENYDAAVRRYESG